MSTILAHRADGEKALEYRPWFCRRDAPTGM